MVDDVVVCDVVEEETALPSEEGTVDCAGCAALERPLALSVVRETLVGVVELYVVQGNESVSCFEVLGKR